MTYKYTYIMYGGKRFYWTSTGERMTAAKNSHQRSLQILTQSMNTSMFMD